MLADQIFTTPFIENLFSDEAELRAMLTVESALARAQSEVGLIPESAVTAIAVVCEQTNWPTEQISQETLLAGNPAIPFVNLLKQRVADYQADAVPYVHFGATSQDVIDTALMLQLKAACAQFDTDLTTLTERLTALHQTYGHLPMIGRTLLQHALPITIGDKLTGWLSGLFRATDRLRRLHHGCLAIQLGGPVGTLAQMGEHGPAIRKRMADVLGLTDAPSWHTQRDRLAELGAELGMLNGSLGKLGQDVTLLMQTEIGEIREGAAAGKGGSSSMPHKRNPVSATFMVAIAHQTPGLVATLLGSMMQPHERAAGEWHSEWPTIRQLTKLTAANLQHANDLMAGLDIDTEQITINLTT